MSAMSVFTVFLKPLLFAACITGIAAQTLTVLDYPGATETHPVAINNSGDIAGWFCTNPPCGASRHGFIRESNGTFTVIDQIPTSMNDAGTVTGSNPNNSSTLWVRSRDGNVTVFDVPLPYSYGVPLAINNRGDIAGYLGIFWVFNDWWAFVRDRQGMMTVFHTDIQAGVIPTGINARGEVVGECVHPECAFLWSPNGGTTMFTVPNQTILLPTDINNNGDVTGTYVDIRRLQHVFVRQKDGTVTEFDPSPGTLDIYGWPRINERGDIAGSFDDSVGLHGFVRDAKGNITVFDVPSGYGARITSINDRSDVIGEFTEFQNGTYITHAFLRTAH